MTRIARYRHQGSESFGFVTEDVVVDRTAIADFPHDSVTEFIASGAPAPDLAGLPTIALSELELLVPLELDKVLCAGVNFPTHVAETTKAESRPEWPMIFSRFPDSHVAPGEAIVKPAVSRAFDYEGEPAVVIGKRAWHVKKEDALDHIWGYSVYNDGSARDWQRHAMQWIPGKNFFKSGSLGPFLVSKDELADIDDRYFETRVNGEVRQHARIGDMLFSIAELIEYTSTFTPLEPGTVIAAGTAGGSGAFMDPPGFLHDGDVVEVEIPGIGILRNPIVEQP